MSNIERIRAKIDNRWDSTHEVSPGVVCEVSGLIFVSIRVYIYDWNRFLSTPGAQKTLEALKNFKIR